LNDGRYAKEFLAGWATMDINGHMANTAYLDLAADVRMAFFAEHGFPPRGDGTLDRRVARSACTEARRPATGVARGLRTGSARAWFY
jgi:hypothetical protein